MKHIYDPKEYPYSQRKEEKVYEVIPSHVAGLTSKQAYDLGHDTAHNVREAYPTLAIAAVEVKVPLVLTLTAEGLRLTEHEAIVQALQFADNLRPNTAVLRGYSQTLKEETGLIFRNVKLHVPEATTISEPKPSEIEAAREAALIV